MITPLPCPHQRISTWRYITIIYSLSIPVVSLFLNNLDGWSLGTLLVWWITRLHPPYFSCRSACTRNRNSLPSSSFQPQDPIKDNPNLLFIMAINPTGRLLCASLLHYICRIFPFYPWRWRLEVQRSIMIWDYYNGKTLFITGGTGFIGTALLCRLLSQSSPKRVYVLCRGGSE